jgi:hypothetical protein
VKKDGYFMYVGEEEASVGMQTISRVPGCVVCGAIRVCYRVESTSSLQQIIDRVMVDESIASMGEEGDLFK